MALKAKIKSLEDIVNKEINEELSVFQNNSISQTPVKIVPTPGDLEHDDEDLQGIQELELVSVGKIEDISRQEL